MPSVLHPIWEMKISILVKPITYSLSQLNHNCTTMHFFGTDGIPPDGTPISVINTFKLELVVIFDILAIFGIAFAIACLLFNIIFRNRKWDNYYKLTSLLYWSYLHYCRTVRLSSPNLNYFIIAGAILMYISIGFYLLPTRSEVVVHARCVVCRLIASHTLC